MNETTEEDNPYPRHSEIKRMQIYNHAEYPTCDQRVWNDDDIANRFCQYGLNLSLLELDGRGYPEKYKTNHAFHEGMHLMKLALVSAFRKALTEMHQVEEKELQTIISEKDDEPFIEIIITPESNDANDEDDFEISA